MDDLKRKNSGAGCNSKYLTLLGESNLKRTVRIEKEEQKKLKRLEKIEEKLDTLCVQVQSFLQTSNENKIQIKETISIYRNTHIQTAKISIKRLRHPLANFCHAKELNTAYTYT